MDPRKLEDKLDKIYDSVTDLLVEQGKTSQSVGKLNERAVAKDAQYRDFESRLTRVEGGMKVLQWAAGILAASTSALIIEMLTKVLAQ